MPTIYNVSHITNILSSTIQRNILVQGEVEILTDGPSNAFYLINKSNKLRCFIPKGVMAPPLEQGQVVVIDGKITLFFSFSQYQITVSDIQVNGVNAKAFDVTEISNKISKLVAKKPELQNIRIQGKVLAVFSAAVSNWDLCDVGGPPELQIKCVRSGSISSPVQVGNNVCVRGNVSIYPSQSRYQIDVTGVDPITENSTEQCQCPGCAQCTSANHQCNRPREIANFESCARCLPRPPDELYELCPECYAMSPDHETKVADAVYAYFHELQVNGFSPYREYQIQFGARNGIADVVLADGNGSFAAIAECKGAGYVGHGIEQLKSYLSATDTRFGIFANTAEPKDWKFYENRGANCIPEIDLSKFKEGVGEGITTRERLRDEIRDLKGEITAGLENQKSELMDAVEQITQTEHNLTERTSDLTQQIETLENYKSELHKEIHRKLDNLLEEKMQKLERPLSDMKIELQKRGIKNWFKNLFSKENE